MNLFENIESIHNMKPNEKTFKAWKALARCLKKHEIDISTCQPIGGSDETWLSITVNGGMYLNMPVIDASEVNNYIKKCEKWYKTER